jgi:hypothetical protein
MLAARNGNKRVVELLVAAGADVEQLAATSNTG